MAWQHIPRFTGNRRGDNTRVDANSRAKQQRLRDLLDEIGRLREELWKVAQARGRLCHPEVVTLSHELDLVVVEYYRTLESSSVLKAATEPS